MRSGIGIGIGIGVWIELQWATYGGHVMCIL
jgi:hypothetical protein